MEQMEHLRPCPIGLQTFSEIIGKRYLYVDKTEYVYKLSHEYKYCFLSRPRRFGKSLLVSTLHSYFEGRKDLFSGLAMEKLEQEWTEYPVLHFDMSMGKHLDRDGLLRYLDNRLAEYEKHYGLTSTAIDPNDRLTALIKGAYKQVGKQVVVLIDEYDAPLLDVVHEEERLPMLRNVMRNFYSPLKTCDPYLRFVFLTGITKFSQLSIFSELNNISDISMKPAYAAICGITKEEIHGNMKGYVDRLAATMGLSHDEAMGRLTKKYDGYHFAWPSPDMFNPYRLLNAFANNDMENYWFGSGTPTYLIEMMRKFSVLPSQIGGMEALAEDFDAPTEGMLSITPLLYQSGYLTIKAYEPAVQLYTLDIPNNEILVGLMRSLLPYYVRGDNVGSGATVIAKMYNSIRKDNMDEALRHLQAFLLTVPQCDNTNYEGHYQQMLYVIFSLFGMYVDVEVRTADGRIDMVMRSSTKLYIIEIKINSNAHTAISQIMDKAYFKRFAQHPLPQVLVGINFDCTKHTITDWEIKEGL